MEWVGRMNSIKSRVEEIVCNELIIDNNGGRGFLPPHFYVFLSKWAVKSRPLVQTAQM